MSSKEREEDIAGTAAETEDCILEQEDNEDISEARKARSFYEATIKQIGPCVKDHKCASLLRDTTISEAAGVTLSHQLHFVHRKATAVLKFCEYRIALEDDPGHVIHAVLKWSKETPSNALRTYVGSILDVKLSGPQVARYVSEYKYFDAVAHDEPVTHAEGPRDEEPLFGRALGIPPGGKGGFHMDRRGQCDHNQHWIFHETDLKLKAQRFMLEQKGIFWIFIFYFFFKSISSYAFQLIFFSDALSVDRMAQYFTDVMLELPTDERDASIKLPVSHTTAWRWMHALGARLYLFDNRTVDNLCACYIFK